MMHHYSDLTMDWTQQVIVLSGRFPFTFLFGWKTVIRPNTDYSYFLYLYGNHWVQA